MVARLRTQRTRPIPSFLFTLLALSLFFSLPLLDTSAQSSQPPTPVWAPGTARTPTRLFINSGSIGFDANPNIPGPSTKQFYYLDLATPWASTSPEWVQLRPGPEASVFPGTASADHKNLFFFKISAANPVYKFSIDTGDWSPALASVAPGGGFGVPLMPGPGTVTDPETDLVYIAGGYSDSKMNFLDVWDWRSGQVTSTPLPAPSVALSNRGYYTSGWCKSRKSILYWGGYSNAIRNVFMTELKPPGDWFTLLTSGPTPIVRADHCMAINDEGTKLIVHGGRIGGDIFSNELFIFDIPSGVWTTGPATPLPRGYMACTFAGDDQFIVWGGIYNMTHIASSDAMIFSLASNAWIKQYTPPASYQNMDVAEIPGAIRARPPGGTPINTTTDSGGLPPRPSSSNGGGNSSGGSRNVGGVVGGVVGGLVVVAAIIGFALYRRRQRQQQRNQQGDNPTDMNSTNPSQLSTTVVTNRQPQHIDVEMMTRQQNHNNQDGNYDGEAFEQGQGQGQGQQMSRSAPQQRYQFDDDGDEWERTTTTAPVPASRAPQNGSGEHDFATPSPVNPRPSNHSPAVPTVQTYGDRGSQDGNYYDMSDLSPAHSPQTIV